MLGWAVSGYQEAAGVLQGAGFASDRRRASLPGLGPHGTPLPDTFRSVGEVFGRMLLFADPPVHGRIRELVGPALGPSAMTRLQPGVARTVHSILDRMDRGQAIDFMGEVARPVAATVLAELLGIPAEDRPRFEGWSNDLEDAIDPRHAERALERASATLEQMHGWLRGVAGVRRERPGKGVIGFLVREGVDQGRLTFDELFATIALLAAVGAETTSYLMGNVMHLLLREPGIRAGLTEEPGLVRKAIEESLRLDSPAQLTARVATEPIAIGTERAGSGDIVVVLLGAANRDPLQFPAPDRVHLARPSIAHLAFGAGRHGCPGAALARMQARFVLSEVLRRFPGAAGDPAAARWKPTVVHRGLFNLPLSL